MARPLNTQNNNCYNFQLTNEDKTELQLNGLNVVLEVCAFCDELDGEFYILMLTWRLMKCRYERVIAGMRLGCGIHTAPRHW